VITPTRETICHPNAKSSHGKLVYKFKVSSFSHSRDILRES